MKFSDMIVLAENKIDIDKTFDFKVNKITCDSREVEPNDVFFALRGSRYDGNKFIKEAFEKGARAVFTDSENVEHDNRIYKVEDTRKMMAVMSNAFYGYPSLKVKLTGITGTNGKTTVSHLINFVLSHCGKKTGLIGTNGNYIGNRYLKSRYTTPESNEFFRLLSDMVNEGVEYVTMEVSSHAVALNRVYGAEFDVAVFTNLSPEHLDFHGSMDAYFEAKKILFDSLKRINDKGNHTAAVYNCNDEYGLKIIRNSEAERIAYGTECGTFTAENIQMDFDGMSFDVLVPPNGEKINRIKIHTGLTGRFNVHNILATIGVLHYYGIKYNDIVSALEEFRSVDGRFNVFRLNNGAFAVIDYSHTPDSLEKAIQSIKEIMKSAEMKGRIITVFGCGGNRDKSKRPVMGRIASLLSDEIIITSDNPRDEEPMSIIKEIISGVTNDNYSVEPDREAAIVKAVKISSKGDVILIAGKGHEDYQEIEGKRIHFSDREIVGKFL
ncbi:MAG: UDP-N-acetylmuramoyl-L-alanyl-D-glutamate--2,6-diaminopimelate ligase [Ignavibacteria bacterium]|nr:UDP-N-acetylmuramoyl-L-alanyl-D-glutamate--2,6-diaminopimelate ligase [Ignavibacteria bacterium]